MSDQDFDAILHGWIVVRYGDESDDPHHLLGIVTNDKKARFTDGRWILTSMLVTPLDRTADNQVVQTLNSRYLLAGAQ